MLADEAENQLWGLLDGLRSSSDIKERIRERALKAVRSVDGQGVRISEEEVKRLEGGLERAKELYIEGTITKAEFHKQSEKLNRSLEAARDNLVTIAPDIRKLERDLPQMERIIDVVREGNLAEQREAIDALVERVEEKDGSVVSVTSRDWAVSLLSHHSLGRSPG